jgi:hypothetical protein
MTFATLLSVSLLVGCATSHQAIGPRVAAGYTDRDHLFALQLRDASSRGPSSGARGLAARLGGNVCGTDIAYDAHYNGQFMTVSGFATDSHSGVDNVTETVLDWHHRTCSPPRAVGLNGGQSDSRAVALEVRDTVSGEGVGERRVRGTIGEAEGFEAAPAFHSLPSHAVDIRFNREQLSGEVGQRTYEMRRRGDDLVGYFTMYGKKVPYILRGADELWSMPAAAQAAVLPLLLTCTEETRVIQHIDMRNLTAANDTVAQP